MEKLVYLLWGRPDPAAGDQLREQLLREVAPALLGLGANALTVNVHDSRAAEAPSPVPAPDGEAAHVAQVSVWVDSYDRRGAMEPALATTGLQVSGYLVTESLYDDYGTTVHASPRWWPDGEPSPGVLTVALIHQPDGLEYDEWIKRWHGTQSPVSAELQPRTRYVRNEVVRALSPDAPTVDGVVEEGWPSAQHVADPMLFFNADGDPQRRDEHVGQMMESVQACLDLTRLRSTTMTEHFVKSF